MPEISKYPRGPCFSIPTTDTRIYYSCEGATRMDGNPNRRDHQEYIGYVSAIIVCKRIGCLVPSPLFACYLERLVLRDADAPWAQASGSIPSSFRLAKSNIRHTAPLNPKRQTDRNTPAEINKTKNNLDSFLLQDKYDSALQYEY